MKKIIAPFALALLGAGLSAQTINVQKDSSTNNITADLNIGSGNTLAGSGTFNFSNGTVSLPSSTITGAPTWSGLQTFNASIISNKIGVGAAPSSSGMDSTVLDFQTRTDCKTSGVSLLQQNLYAPPSGFSGGGSVASSLLGDVFDLGSASDGHCIGIIGRSQNTDAGKMPMAGLEGRTIQRGTLDLDGAVLGISDFDFGSATTDYTGRQRNCFIGFCEIYKNDDTNQPVSGGSMCVYKAYAGVGGDNTQKYALQGDGFLQISTGGAIWSYDSTFAQSISMAHDGTNGFLLTNRGITSPTLAQQQSSLVLGPGSQGYIIMEQGLGMLPINDNTPLGVASTSANHRWSIAATTGHFDGLLTSNSGEIKKVSVLTGGATLDGTYDIVVCNSSSGFTVTLPSSPSTGQHYYIKNKNVGTIVVNGAGLNIDGAATVSETQNVCIEIVYDGTQWDIL